MNEFVEWSAGVLESFRKRYEAGDPDALLQALQWCFGFDVKAPPWVRSNVNSALIRFWSYDADTLDAAFNVTRSQDPRTLYTGRRAPEIRGFVTLRILEAEAAGEDKNEEFFEKVGREFGISKTVVKAYWKQGRAALRLPRKKRKAPSRRR